MFQYLLTSAEGAMGGYLGILAKGKSNITNITQDKVSSRMISQLGLIFPGIPQKLGEGKEHNVTEWGRTLLNQ